MRPWFFVVTCTVAFFLSNVTMAQSASDNLSAPDSIVKRIDDGIYKIGRVFLNQPAGSITMPGWINMDRGPVEYLAVTPHGKTHESVVVLDIKPLNLMTALLLCGLDYGQNLAFQGDTTAPQGDSVKIFIEWEGDSGDTLTKAAADMVYDYNNKAPMKENWWVFTGSFIYDNGLAADREGSIIATYSDPVAILNTPAWGRYDDTVYGVNEELVPVQKTPIRLIIKLPEKTGVGKGDK